MRDVIRSMYLTIARPERVYFYPVKIFGAILGQNVTRYYPLLPVI